MPNHPLTPNEVQFVLDLLTRGLTPPPDLMARFTAEHRLGSDDRSFNAFREFALPEPPRVDTQQNPFQEFLPDPQEFGISWQAGLDRHFTFSPHHRIGTPPSFTHIDQGGGRALSDLLGQGSRQRGSRFGNNRRSGGSRIG